MAMVDGSRAGSAGARRGAGELEAEVLAALWSADRPLTPVELQRALGGGLAYNTVHTILTRLCDKALVLRARRGRRAAYRPASDAAQWAADRMRRALDGGADRTAVLQRFVTSLDPAEEQALRDLLGAEPPR